jgi:uncharacterized protein YbjT (DUF2867 family)
LIVVTSATSNTGTAVAEALLAHGRRIRVVGRSRDRLQHYVDRGAEAVVAAPDDGGALREAFADAQAAFVMLAPGLIPDSPDFAAHQRRVITAHRDALASAPDLARVVTLSGWAANFEGARGPVWGLRRLEEAIDGLSTLSDDQVVHLRAGWFMENALPMIQEIRATGRSQGLIRGDLPLPAIATSDIGRVAADLLTGTRPITRHVLELQGPEDITLRQVTTAIGRAVGRPDARYEDIDADTLRSGLLAAGFSAHMAEGTTEMTIDVADQRIAMLQARDAETRTPTTFADFLAEVLPGSDEAPD